MAEIPNFSDLDLTKQYTYADYLLWKFEERVELLRGFIRKMSPAPSRRHQTILQNINKKLLNVVEGKTCNVYVAPFDVRLPIPSAKKDTTVVQPDICVVCDESKLDDYGCIGAPDLIVEILSPSNSKHDIDTKFGLYEEAGVQEYWMVEPEEKMVLVYTLQNGKYIGMRPYTVDQIVDSPLFPVLKIAVNEVFDKV
jgi:Uma2 family endonuclease